MASAKGLITKPIKQDWLVENIIERGSLNLFWGEPGRVKHYSPWIGDFVQPWVKIGMDTGRNKPML
ncbi:MAG: hypothetical protein IPN42_18335 [Methylococcaceae bacterium]|nr:hypothetical protein [Methylococcaceae bacterium]